MFKVMVAVPDVGGRNRPKLPVSCIMHTSESVTLTVMLYQSGNSCHTQLQVMSQQSSLHIQMDVWILTLAGMKFISRT